MRSRGADGHPMHQKDTPPMTITEPTPQYAGATLRDRREALDLSLTDVRDWLVTRLPKHKVPSTSKLSRMERNLAPYADIADLIYALCALYNLRISEVSIPAAEELERSLDLLTSLEPWTTVLPGQQVLELAAFN